MKKAAEDKKSSTTDWLKLIAKPNIFDHKSQEEEIKALREWSWVFEKYLSAVDEGYMKDLRETHDKPSEKFDMDLATECATTSTLEAEVFDETVKSKTTTQKELKPTVLSRCVGGKLKSYLN